MAISEAERSILDWLAQQHDAMVALLAEAVCIDSGSYSKRGVDAVGKLFRARLAKAGIASEAIANPEFGDCVLAQVSARGGRDGGGHALLLGHMDTVFPDGVAADRPFRIDGKNAFGPGVADMKGGLVINTFVAEAFARAAGAPMPIKVLYTADEEIASPSSRPAIEAAARGACLVLNGEPGRPSGNVVTSRKGAMFIDIETIGRAAHSGVNHTQGASAIEAMARKTQKLHALTNYDSGVTVNVGLIEGGVSINTVAPHASAEIDVRFKTFEDMEAVKRELAAIVEAVEIPDTSGRIRRIRNFLPLVENDANRSLFECYSACARDLGFEVRGEFTGGSADSGFTSAAGAPTLCGTGPVGANAHTPEEFCRLDTLVLRAQAIALTIMRYASATPG
jgi:glutamate carboxypeptidase